MINGQRLIGSKWYNNGNVYLPYSGRDEDVILRLFKGYIRLVCPEFIIDDSNFQVIESLVNIAAGKAQRNGLILRGACGVGKTALLKIWLKFRLVVLSPFDGKRITTLNDRDRNRVLKIVFLDPSTLISRFAKEGYSFFENHFGDILFIDDLGLTTNVNHFGTITNILEELIYCRYSKTKELPTCELYGTTNLTSLQLAELIGERAISRIMEMASWNEGLLQGPDRRKSENYLKQWPTLMSEVTKLSN